MLRGAVCKIKIRVKPVCLCLSDISLVSYHFHCFTLVEGETSLFSFLSVGYSSPGIRSLTMAGGTDMDLTEPLRIAEVRLSPENTASEKVRRTEWSAFHSSSLNSLSKSFFSSMPGDC